MLSARGPRPAFSNAAVQWNASRHTVLGKNRQDVYVMHCVTVSVSVNRHQFGQGHQEAVVSHLRPEVGAIVA